MLENGLRAVVVSDPRADMAAAALDVGVGQFHDPPDREGLAHFLEHMLFMGTDRYPDVDDYRRFVQDHGGSTNAGTGQERTRYHFRIEHSHLAGALDRFARFFCAPTLDPAYVAREREAVDSEYRLKLKDDARRFREVRRKTVNPAHGFAKFSVGDRDTLADRPGRPVWSDLKAFYDAHYTADRMSLAVVGRESVDTLERWVRERFEEVPATGVTRGESAPPYLPENLGVRIHVRPLVDVRSVRIELPTPDDRPFFRERPLELMSFLLGQEGEGSLHAALHARGWITGLSTSRDGAEDHRLFVVQLSLTEEGYAHLDDAIDLVFQMIRRVREAPTLAPWFDELARIAAMGFENHQPPSPLSAARSLAARMPHAPDAHLLDQPWVWGDFDPSCVSSFLQCMRPERARVFVAAPDLETDRLESRYDVPWSVTPLDPALVARWSSGPIEASLCLPAPNAFLAERFTLLPDADTAHPVIAHEAEGATLWHHQDTSFKVPRATVRMRFVLPPAFGSLRARVLNILYAAVIRDAINTLTDPLARAGLSVALSSATDGLLLQVSGYDDKQALVVDAVLRRVAEAQLRERDIEVQRKRLARQWRNASREYPIRQVGWAVNELLDPTDFAHAEGVEILLETTPDDLRSYAHGLFGVASVEALAHGNLDVERARSMVHAGLRELGGSAAVRPPRRVRRLGRATVIRDLEIDHNDSCIASTWQAESDSDAETAAWLVVGAAIRTPFFRVLRTEKQLGYTVHAAYDRTDRLAGLRCGIQSPVADPAALLQHIDDFMARFPDELRGMTPERFSDIRAGVLSQLRKADDTLYERTARFARELALGSSSFDRRPRLARAVASVEQQALATFFEQRVLGGGRLIVRSTGLAHLEHRPSPVHTTHASAIAAFEGEYVRD